jgi:hypothetical protein
MTLGRNRQRGLQCAVAVGQALDVPSDAIFVLLNWDFNHESHFEAGSTLGKIAFYDSLAQRVLPLLSGHHLLKEAVLHILIEDDCVVSLKGENKLDNLVRTCFPAKLSMLGYFNPKTKPKHSSPPMYGTQMFAVRGDFCDELASHMKAFPANDIDMYFLGPAPCRLGSTSISVAGQGAHTSDCCTTGKYKQAWHVEPPAVEQLTLKYVDEHHRLTQWSAYVGRSRDFFSSIRRPWSQELFQKSLHAQDRL